MKPRIGITCTFGEATPDGYFLHAQYVEAITAAGGLPVVLPAIPGIDAGKDVPEYAKAYARLLDGLLAPGGGDADPIYYGEEPSVHHGRIDPIADRFELALIREMLALDRPILGICRGMQVLNVAAGGDLHQDIQAATGSSLQHTQRAPKWYATHEVQVEKGSLLEAVVQVERLRVNTFHHQAVRQVAPGFVASAVAGDGIVEAIERPGSTFVLGVQWHPERMLSHDEAARRLFEAFVDAARRQQARA